MVFFRTTSYLQQVLEVAPSFRAAELGSPASVPRHPPHHVFIHVPGEVFDQLLQLLQGFGLALDDVRSDHRPEAEIQTG